MTLCSFSSFCSLFCSNLSLSIPSSQSPVDSDNESIRFCFPALVFSASSMLLCRCDRSLNPPAWPAGTAAATHWAGINPGASSLASEWAHASETEPRTKPSPHQSTSNEPKRPSSGRFNFPPSLACAAFTKDDFSCLIN